MRNVLLRICGIALLALMASLQVRGAPANTPVVNVVSLNGVVGPAMAHYVTRAVDQSVHDNAQALIMELDTPGGLMQSMDQITKVLLNSRVPTVVYIYPSGARAASAGVFITYASNIAAMASATHLGAAHPVSIGSGQLDKTEMTKITNDAVAEIREFAIRRGRNSAWGEQAVRQSVSVTGDEALRLHVINLIADTPGELLSKLDGLHVHTASGLHRLETRNARLAEIPMNLSERFLSLLSDPNVGFILLTLAMYGLIFELSNPGLVFPGVIGGISLILALASFAAIEVNVAGLLFIGFAIVLFIADIKVPSHGVLTAGGLASFVLGALLLTENEAPFLRISLTLIITIAAVTAAFFMFAVGAGVRAQGRKVQTGREALIGATGVARCELTPMGTVFVQGELWSAEAVDGIIPEGARVVVERVAGLLLRVRNAERSQ
jgi:membrane-bound serine protease (ClpP class)